VLRKLLLIVFFPLSIFANNIWLDESGHSTKAVTTYKDLYTPNDDGFKITNGTIKLASLQLQNKFNCNTGEIDIVGGIDSYINDFLNFFSSGSLKTLFEQMQYQTQLELIQNIIARIHYAVVVEGFEENPLKKMMDSSSITACIENRLKASVEGTTQIGIGTSKEDIVQFDIGVDFMELVGIQGCLSIGKIFGGGLDEDKWKISLAKAKKIMKKIMDLLFRLDGNQSATKLSQKCEDLMSEIFAGEPLTNPRNPQKLEKIKDGLVERIKTHGELLLNKTQSKLRNELKFIYNYGGQNVNLDGTVFKGGIEAEVVTIGPEPQKADTNNIKEEDIENTKEVAENNKENTNTTNKNTTTKEEKVAETEIKTQVNAFANMLKDTSFNTTMECKPNIETIDILQPSVEQNYEIYDYLFSELLLEDIYKTPREAELYNYLVRKLFSLKKVNREYANTFLKIKKLIIQKVKDNSKDPVKMSENEIYNFCKAPNGKLSPFNPGDKEEKIIFAFANKLAKKAEKKYLESNIKISEKDQLEIINNAQRIDQNTGNKFIDKEFIVKEYIKLQYEKLQKNNYKTMYYKDGRPTYVSTKDFFTKSDGEYPIGMDKNIFLETKNNETIYDVRKNILKNTMSAICMESLNINRDKNFTNVSFGTNNTMFDFYSMMLDNMELMDTIRVLYDIENPEKMYMFMSKGRSSEESQLLGVTTEKNYSNYVIPDKIMYGLNQDLLSGITKRDLVYLIKVTKFIKRKLAINQMKIHGNMYAQLNAISQDRNKYFKDPKYNSLYHYQLELIRHNMLKRQLMLQLLLDKR